MAGVTLIKLGPCGTPPHWHYKARIDNPVDCGIEFVRWCQTQFGDPGTDQRWDYFFGEGTAVIVLVHDENDAFALKMRWT